MKTYRNPGNVHLPLAAYSHQVEIRGPERMLVLSGQVGRREDGTVPADPIEQLEAALENVRRNLKAADMEISDLSKLTLFLAGEMDGAQRRAAMHAILGEHRPCMTLVYVVALADPAYKIEIDAWASREA